MHGPALGQSSPFVAKLQRAVELAADHASGRTARHHVLAAGGYGRYYGHGSRL